MTELLTREKEFLKLNQRLDQMTATALEHQQKQNHITKGNNMEKGTTSSGGTSGPAKGAETRFNTYTKYKGPTSLLKKRGAGDANPMDSHADHARPMRTGYTGRGVTPVSNTTTGSSSQRTDEETLLHIGPGRYRRVSSPTRNLHYTLNPPHHGVESATGRKTTRMTASTPPAVMNAQRKVIRGPENSTRSYSRTNSRPVHNPAPFTVKYRNPKFVQSPSLEILLKEGSASIEPKFTRASASPTKQLSPVRQESTTSANADRGMTGSPRAAGGGNVNNANNKKQLSTEGLIKFLKSKIVILEEDHDRISQEMLLQKELLDKTLERQKKVEQQRDLACAKSNTIAEQLVRAESQLEEARCRVKECHGEYTTQQKELDTVKREVKMLTQSNVNLEKRLYRANDEIEHAKNANALIKNNERELREMMRNEADIKDKQIKSLKKQRADLLNAYKKQLYLIDNLKRQNACLEQSKLVAFNEKEFTKVLDWDTTP